MNKDTLEKVVDVRFIVPPVLTLIFVFFSAPEFFLGFVKDFSNNFIYALIPLIILALGVLISGIGEFVISNFDFRNWKYAENEGRTLREILPSEESRVNDADVSELGSWIILSRISGKDGFVKNQIVKRWYWAATNLNSSISIALAFLFVLCNHLVCTPLFIQKPAVGLWWFVSSILFFCVFLKNFFGSYESMREMHKVLARNYSSLVSFDKSSEALTPQPTQVNLIYEKIENNTQVSATPDLAKK